MRKKSLCLLAAIAMAMTMIFPFMAPVMGAGEQTPVSPNPDISYFTLPSPYYNVTFDGTSPNTSLTIKAAAPTGETSEYTGEVVPLVRWAGEKIVLEKYFGPAYEHKYVRFSLTNQNVGSLEPISAIAPSENGAVWTPVINGFASAILYSANQREAQVLAGLYEAINGVALGQQQFFTVYFLEFESLTIGSVPGKRELHNAGLWNPASPNPWNNTSDITAQTLNVSQDALVRARVKGWFTNSNPSVRPARMMDPADSSLDNPVTASLTLPAGRWILPDDWAALAGPNWQESRIHWDIMNTIGGNSTPAGTEYAGAAAVYMASPLYNATTNPNVLKNIENVTAAGELGDYYLYVGADYKYKSSPAPAHTKYDIVGNDDVIGPFSPGLELMTPAGWAVSATVAPTAPLNDPAYRNMHTVVPDGYLDWWDAPMPPAKVIYQIQDAGANPNKNEVGYFKAVNKTDIYYIWAANTSWTSYTDDPNDAYDQYIKVYTNPFYQEMIPAHEAIPACINNDGYDWDSFPANGSYGPYVFWKFINQNRYLPLVVSSDPAGHPTCVEVFSDNHGEAMVWLNGDWNLDLNCYASHGAADVPYNTVVGSSIVQSIADYPYYLTHQAIQSNKDVKTWLWGGLVLGPDNHQYGDQTWSAGEATKMVLSIGTWDQASEMGTFPYESARSLNKMVWLWVTDRDGKQQGVLGAKVKWEVNTLQGSVIIPDIHNPLISIYSYHTYREFYLGTPGQDDGGFLRGTYGSVADAGRTSGYSYLRSPTSAEKELFKMVWGSGYTDSSGNYTPPTSSLNGFNPDNFAVAAIGLVDLNNSYSSTAVVTAQITSNDFNLVELWQSEPGILTYQSYVDFGIRDPLGIGWEESFPSHKITAGAGTNGKISPSGVLNIRSGTDPTFTVTPDAGYRIAQVLVDGVPAAITGNYTFTDLQADHTISATFSLDTPADVNLNVTLQGGSRPDAGWAAPLTVKFFISGNTSTDVLTATPVYTRNLSSVKSGSTAAVQVPGILPGTYDITVNSPYCLLNVKRNVLVIAPLTSLDMGIMLEGNANNDEKVNIQDFGLLAATYGRQRGQAGFDENADFDRNDIINITDFGLLAANYGKYSPIEIP